MTALYSLCKIIHCVPLIRLHFNSTSYSLDRAVATETFDLSHSVTPLTVIDPKERELEKEKEGGRVAGDAYPSKRTEMSEFSLNNKWIVGAKTSSTVAFTSWSVFASCSK